MQTSASQNHRKECEEKLGRLSWTDEHLCFDALKWHLAAAKNRPELCGAQGGDNMRAGLLPGETHATIPGRQMLVYPSSHIKLLRAPRDQPETAMTRFLTTDPGSWEA